jgi:cation diffusion facilitator CzcD-associated flavoprotein CzcO
MNYLNQLAKSENLLPWIRFLSLVTNVVFENDCWKVSVRDPKGTYTEEFDAVVVATGHYAVPYVPDLPGLAELNHPKHIQLLHSSEYRHPEIFKDKVIHLKTG